MNKQEDKHSIGSIVEYDFAPLVGSNDIHGGHWHRWKYTVGNHGQLEPLERACLNPSLLLAECPHCLGSGWAGREKR